MKRIILPCIALFLVLSGFQGTTFKPLLNGKNLDGWYIYVEDKPSTAKPEDVFKMEKGGILHVSGERFGYIATRKVFRNFHLRLEFKWGEKKYAPRLDLQRDSGICYAIPENEPDHIWPKAIECQIQEQDVGDFWMIGGATIAVDGVTTTPGDFIRSAKKKDAEKPHGEWNLVEVIFNQGTIRHIVNGVLVNECTQPSLTEGKILLQSEGAELFYRNVQISEL